MSKSKIKRVQKSYTAEFKEEAVKLITEQGYKLHEAARSPWGKQKCFKQMEASPVKGRQYKICFSW